MFTDVACDILFAEPRYDTGFLLLVRDSFLSSMTKRHQRRCCPGDRRGGSVMKERQLVSFYDDHGGVLQSLCAHSSERVAWRRHVFPCSAFRDRLVSSVAHVFVNCVGFRVRLPLKLEVVGRVKHNRDQSGCVRADM